MNAPDRDIRELLQPLIAAEPSEERPQEALDRAIEEASESMRGRRGWKRRFGPPAGLVLGVLVVGAAAATATGVISFGGLATSTSRDDTSAPELRGLIGRLERQPGTERPLLKEEPMLSGHVVRDELDIDVALTKRRVCISAPGHQVIGRDYEDLRGHPDTERTDLPSPDEIPRARDLAKRPRQLACVGVAHLDDQLPAISGFGGHRSWIVTLAPDQVDEVRATTADRQTVVLTKAQNLAVARSTSPFTKVLWTDADGESHEYPIPTEPAGGNDE